MLAGVKDREGNLITCDDNCPWVPYGGHWPAFGEPNEVFDKPATEPEEIVALRLVDSPFNLNSAAMGFVCGFWTPNGHCRRDGTRINWVSGDPDCLHSPVLCGTGRTSGRQWSCKPKQSPAYSTITRGIPRETFFGRIGILRDEWCFQVPPDSPVPPRFFGNRAVLATKHGWQAYLQSCAAVGLPVDAVLKEAQLKPLIASEDLVAQTSVLTKPSMLATSTDSSVYQHVAVTHQEGYRLHGELPSPNAGVAVTTMRKHEGGLFRSRSETRSVGAISSREVSLGPKSRSHLEKAETQVTDPALRSQIRRAQFGRNELPGELYVPPELKALRTPSNLADAIGSATVFTTEQHDRQLIAVALPPWQHGTKWSLDLSSCRTPHGFKVALSAYVGSSQPAERAQEYTIRGFGCLYCFWNATTVCDEIIEAV